MTDKGDSETRLRVIETPESQWDTEIGDMWRVPARDRPDREDWAIHCPGPGVLIWHTTDPATGTDQLWDVTGEPPDITVSPSINASPGWHGFIRGGRFE